MAEAVRRKPGRSSPRVSDDVTEEDMNILDPGAASPSPLQADQQEHQVAAGPVPEIGAGSSGRAGQSDPSQRLQDDTIRYPPMSDAASRSPPATTSLSAASPNEQSVGTSAPSDEETAVSAAPQIPDGFPECDLDGNPIDYSKFPYNWRLRPMPYKALFHMGNAAFTAMWYIGRFFVGVLGIEEPRFKLQLEAAERMREEEEERKRELDADFARVEEPPSPPSPM